MSSLPRRLLLFICMMGTTSLQGQEAPVVEAHFNCGLNAAYIYLNRAGHHVDYDELVREFQAQSPSDSLLAIRNVLARHACPTVALKIDPDYFLAQSGPAIVYLVLDGYSLHGEGHFSYLVRASKAGGVLFLDPLFEANKGSLMTWDTFTRLFKGVALVAHD